MRNILVILLIIASLPLFSQEKKEVRQFVREFRKAPAEKQKFTMDVFSGTFFENPTPTTEKIVVRERVNVPVPTPYMVYRDTCERVPTRAELRTERITTKIDAKKEIQLAIIEKDRQIQTLRLDNRRLTDSISKMSSYHKRELRNIRQETRQGQSTVRDTTKSAQKTEIKSQKQETKRVRIKQRPWFYLFLFSTLLLILAFIFVLRRYLSKLY